MTIKAREKELKENIDNIPKPVGGSDDLLHSLNGRLDEVQAWIKNLSPITNTDDLAPCRCDESDLDLFVHIDGAGDVGSRARIKCKSCGIEMNDHSSRVGFGVTKEEFVFGLKNKWNKVMRVNSL